MWVGVGRMLKIYYKQLPFLKNLIIFKVFMEFVTILFLVYVLTFWP